MSTRGLPAQDERDEISKMFASCPAEVRQFEPELRALGLPLAVLTEVVSTALSDIESPVNAEAERAVMEKLEEVTATPKGKLHVTLEETLTPEQQARMRMSRPDYFFKFSGKNRMQHGLAHGHRSADFAWIRSEIPKAAVVHEMGGSIAKIILMGLDGWSTTSPVLDMRHGARGEAWKNFLVRVTRGSVRLRDYQRRLFDKVMANPERFYCTHRASTCTCGRRFDVVVAAHSAYDDPVREVAMCMAGGGATLGIGTLVYPSAVATRDNGYDEDMDAVFDVDREEDRIRFSFFGDPSAGYAHNFGDYLRWGYDQDIVVGGQRFAYRVVKRYTHSIGFKLHRVPTTRSYEPLSNGHWQDTGAKGMIKITGPRIKFGSWRLGPNEFESNEIFVPTDTMRRMIEKGLVEGVGWSRMNAHSYAMTLNVFFVLGGKRLGTTDRMFEETLEYFVDYTLALVAATIADTRRDIRHVLQRVKDGREGGVLKAAVTLLNRAVGRTGVNSENVVPVGTGFIRRMCTTVVDARVDALIPTCHKYFDMELVDIPVTWTDGSEVVPWAEDPSKAHVFPPDVELEAELVDALLRDGDLEPDDCEELREYLGHLNLSRKKTEDTPVPTDSGYDSRPASVVTGNVSQGVSRVERGYDEDEEVEVEEEVYCEPFIGAVERGPGYEAIQEYSNYMRFVHRETVATAAWFMRQTCVAGEPTADSCKGQLTSPTGRDVKRHSTDRMRHDYLMLERGVVTSALVGGFDTLSKYAVAMRTDNAELITFRRVGRGDKRVCLDESGYTGWVYVNSTFEVFNDLALSEAAAKILLDPSCGHIPPVEARYGVPGCGKSRMCTDLVVSNPVLDFALLTSATATKNEAKELILDRWSEKVDGKRVYDEGMPVGLVQYLRTHVRTIDSLLMNGGAKCRRVYIDEACMVHAGALMAAIYLTGAREVIILGDDRQIVYLQREQGFNLLHCDFIDETTVKWYRHTYRFGAPTAAAISDDYDGLIRLKARPGHELDDTKLTFVKISGLSEVPKLKGVLYVAFTQDEKEELRRSGYGNTITMAEFEELCRLSVHEAQGQNVKTVILVRLDVTNAANGIYTWPRHCVVALTRHQVSFSYYSRAPGMDGVKERILKSQDPVRLARVRGEYDVVGDDGEVQYNVLKPLTQSELKGMDVWANEAAVVRRRFALTRRAASKEECF